MGKYDVIAAGLMKMKPHVVQPTFVEYGINADGLTVFDPWGVIVKNSLNGVETFSKMLLTDIYTIFSNKLITLKPKVIA